jgi:ribosomal-protein-alanine N-acetyltransferase
VIPASDLRFRSVRPGDLPRVVEIERGAFSHPWSEELLRRELEHDWSIFLLATEEGRGPGAEAVVGFVIAWVVHDELHVLNVAVAPEERRRGTGRALMAEIQRRGRRLGARLATLEVRRSNEAALGLYRALGWRQAGMRPGYYADENEDAIVMELEL